ncbi:hypothetical protein [Mycolicibacterium obuense]|uniref:DUF4267 domain-containing protein n=1 Tax=Mycolicibacterium obuense TaxID=1807 RepID=A0A0M2JZU7_9MYCO|nr:hypothetical protein [Mycolicibacterium obuense]KKF02154.1 hypothetical protein WN67_10095 [Mycolicibacterium obuense]OKH74277.1 hypothetical protein EB72_17125 [Mycobacterium sp. SWH-M1]
MPSPTKQPIAYRATTAMAVLRAFAGAFSWISPRHAWRTFLLGAMPADGSTGLISRLFGIRDLLLAAGLRHPDASVRRAVLGAGIVIDSADIAATALAVRAGAPRGTLLGVAAGAALFVAMGAVALAEGD